MILHEDRDLLVVDKPAGLLTMGTDSDKTRTATFFNGLCPQGLQQSRNRIFIVHGLDRETSRIVIFAKNVETKFRLPDQSKHK